MTSPAGTSPTLVGRDDDLHRIRAHFDDAAIGGGALLLLGDPGIGKTAVLDEVAAGAAARGSQVLRASGVEFEADVSYAGLNQLLFGLMEELDGLGPTHRDALRVAMGFGAGAAPDRLLVSNAALLLVRQAAAGHPLLLVVDDLPWMDRASAAVLGFVARRLVGSQVGFLGASRTKAGLFFDAGGLSFHELRPLDPAAAEELVTRRHPSIAAAVRRRVREEAMGNPLALLELPTALTGPQRRATAGLPAVLPLPQRLQALFASRIAALPENCRQLMLLGALDRSGGRDALRASEGAYELDSLAPAERDQLVQIEDNTQRFVFRHPLIRTAVVEASTSGERHAAHRALAAVLADHPERHAWHLGESALGPDEQVAGKLEEAARLMLLRGDAVGAIASLVRSADLSPVPADRGRRLAEAAYLGADAVGELLGASHLLDEARKATGGTSLHAATAASILLINGDGDVLTAYQLLIRAVEAVDGPYDANDPALVESLYHLVLLCWFAGREELWPPVLAMIDQLTPAVPDLLWVLRRTFPDPARTGPEAAAALDRMLGTLDGETDHTRIVRLGTASVYLDRLAGTREGHWQIVRQGRAGQAAARRHAAALMHLCHDMFHTGQWDVMIELADEGFRLCEEHNYRFFIWYFRHQRSLYAAVRGDHAASQAMTDDMIRWARARSAGGVEWFIAHPRTLNHLGQGDWEGAYREATVAAPPGVIASHIPHAMWTALDLVEAALRTDRPEQAAAHAEAMRATGLPLLSPRMALVTATATAMVAGDDDFRGLFDAALALPGIAGWPFDRARAQLVYGERLRRLRATSEARTHLTAASEAFRALGARPWLERAESELRATGLNRTRRDEDRAAVLTPQEREIADLAGSGLTNKQIGERLFLSHRTVGAHLYQIFPKLGIASRAALRDALAALPEPQD